VTSPLSGPPLRHAPTPIDSGEVGLDGVVRYLREIDAPVARRCVSPSCPRPPIRGQSTCEVCGG